MPTHADLYVTANGKDDVVADSAGSSMDKLSSKRKLQNSETKRHVPQMRITHVTDLSRLNTIAEAPSPEKSANAFGKPLENSSNNDLDKVVRDKIASNRKLGTTVKEGKGTSLPPASEPTTDVANDPTLPSDVSIIYYRSFPIPLSLCCSHFAELVLNCFVIIQNTASVRINLKSPVL